MIWLTDPLVCALAPLAALPVIAALPRRRPAWASAAAAAGLVAQAFVILLTAQASGWLARGGVAAGGPPTAWLTSAGASWDLRLDGMNLVPALLTPALGLGALVASWRDGGERSRERAMALLLTAAAAVGVFCSFDLVALCFALQVAALAAAYLLGSVADEAGRRAAVRFAVFHLAAATALLALVLGLQAWLEGPAITSLEGLSAAAAPAGVQSALLAAAVLCFAVPMALVPAHGWLASACASGGRTGALLVMGLWHQIGVYGLCRVGLGLFPAAAARWAGTGAALAVVATVYAALIAAAQPDLRRRLAWVSAAFSGSMFLALCTGTVEGAVGAMLMASAQAPVRLVLAALAQRAPAPRDGVGEAGRTAAALWLVASLALVALPGSGAFAGAVLAGTSIARDWPIHGLLVLGALGLASGAQLAPYARLRGGPGGSTGLSRGLRLVGAAALALALLSGLRPAPLVELIRPAVSAALGAPTQAPHGVPEPEAADSSAAEGGS